MRTRNHIKVTANNGPLILDGHTVIPRFDHIPVLTAFAETLVAMDRRGDTLHIAPIRGMLLQPMSTLGLAVVGPKSTNAHPSRRAMSITCCIMTKYALSGLACSWSSPCRSEVIVFPSRNSTHDATVRPPALRNSNERCPFPPEPSCLMKFSSGVIKVAVSPLAARLAAI